MLSCNRRHSLKRLLGGILLVAALPVFSSYGYAASSPASTPSFGAPGLAGIPVSLKPGWNLIGNSTDNSLDVASWFGDVTKIYSVWKWLNFTKNWAFYTPSQPDGGASYASTRGYGVLTTIDGGEGFWVNAKQEFDLVLPADNQVTASGARLKSGWNLVAIGENLTPGQYNKALGDDVTSLWAWERSQSKWYFYAPLLMTQGGTVLADYINSHGYLDFAANSKSLERGIGFWVNKLHDTVTFNLGIVKAGTGIGTISANPSATNFASGSSVTITAIPGASSIFTGWSGACSGTMTTCTVVMNANQTVVGSFYPTPTGFTLTKTTSGFGWGTIAASPSGSSYPIGSVVTLTATPSKGLTVILNGVARTSGASTFTGWSGACSGTMTTCQVTMDSDKTVIASFYSPDAVNYPLQVIKSGAGQGTVTSSSAGINCGDTCSASFWGDSTVTLAANAASGSVFGGWSGACSGTETCSVTMNAAKTVTAIFDLVPPPFTRLTVTKIGGTGIATSSPAGIDCGTNCSADFAYGTLVTLTATADAGYALLHWDGQCNSTSSGGEGGPSIGGSNNLQGTCQVTMNADRSFIAHFSQQVFSLQVDRIYSGAGSLTVRSEPPGIVCPNNCYASFPAGTLVTLTATPSAGAAFAGWAEACNGTDSVCNLIMDGYKYVKAYYGSGSSPPPQNCASAPVTITVSSAYGAITWLNIQGVGAWAIPLLSRVTINDVPKGLYTLTIITTLGGQKSQSINVGCVSNLAIFR